MDDEAEHQVDRKVLDVLFVVEALYVASSTRLASRIDVAVDLESAASGLVMGVFLPRFRVGRHRVDAHHGADNGA